VQARTAGFEDLAYDDPFAGDVDLFEHFRPDTSAFLNAFGRILCAAMVAAPGGRSGTRLVRVLTPA
jgi:hypothetical protein